MSPGEIHERIEAISREEHHELIRFIRQYTKSPFIAEEVLQEAYLEALKRADQIRNPDKLISWIKTVAKRIAMDEIEKQNRLLKKCARLIDYTFSSWEDELIERVIVEDALNKILRASPPHYRKVIQYRYSDGMSYVRIARELDISVSNARQINSRIIRKLRKEMREIGFD